MIKKIEPRALYTHCYGHALNLACADTIKQCKLMKDALETTHEITKLVKLSPKRDAKFQTIRESADDDGTSKNVRLLCRTRWTVRADAMQSVIDNYKELFELWDWSLDVYKDTETKARVQGVASQMERFDFFFGLALGARILKHADSLSTTLQRKDLSSCEGQEIALMTVKTLEGIRNDDSFNLFWQRVTAESKLKEVNDPQLPRKRRAPIRVEECFSGSAKAEFPATASAYFRHAYYEALDLVISCIKSRFDQTDYKMHSSCERVLLKSVSGGDFTEELKTVTQFYGSDFAAENLRSHLEILGSNYSGQGQPNIHDIFEYLRHLTPAKRALMGDAVKLAKLIMTIPATNASSERAISTLRYVKNYLRNTMLQERLNSLMVTYVHRDELDHLNLNAIADDFVNGRENRMGFFGSFDS